MQILNKLLSKEGFEEYLRQKVFGPIRPNKLVIHHTWRPKKEAWRGSESILALKNYYELKKKWSAGPHLFIEDGGIWLFTDMDDVGIHAGKLNATWQMENGSVEYGFIKPKGSILKEYSIGIEIVGDYDLVTWSGKTKENAISAIKSLLSVLNLSFENIYFHRESANKSCPGLAITKEWLKKQLDEDQGGNKTWEDEIKEADKILKEKGIITATPNEKKLGELDAAWLKVVLLRLLKSLG